MAIQNPLAALRAEKLRRTPSTIIRRHRAAKALAASRMAAKVALDKLEARAAVKYDPEEAAAEAERREHPKLVGPSVRMSNAGLAEDRAVSLHAADLLDHARDQGSNLEMALEDFRGEKELLGEMGDLVLSRAYDIDQEVA